MPTVGGALWTAGNRRPAKHLPRDSKTGPGGFLLLSPFDPEILFETNLTTKLLSQFLFFYVPILLVIAMLNRRYIQTKTVSVNKNNRTGNNQRMCSKLLIVEARKRRRDRISETIREINPANRNRDTTRCGGKFISKSCQKSAANTCLA